MPGGSSSNPTPENRGNISEQVADVRDQFRVVLPLPRALRVLCRGPVEAIPEFDPTLADAVPALAACDLAGVLGLKPGLGHCRFRLRRGSPGVGSLCGGHGVQRDDDSDDGGAGDDVERPADLRQPRQEAVLAAVPRQGLVRSSLPLLTSSSRCATVPSAPESLLAASMAVSGPL